MPVIKEHNHSRKIDKGINRSITEHKYNLLMINKPFILYDIEMRVLFGDNSIFISAHLIIVQVDFETMHMFKPWDRDIRRSFQTGLWLQLKTSEHQMQFHAKIQKMQV